MTYEAEMKEYLQAKKLPVNDRVMHRLKGTYPKKLMTQITITAFDELLERIQELEEDLRGCDDERMTFNTKLENFQTTFKQIKELTDEGV